jgi:hypothetical protein
MLVRLDGRAISVLLAGRSGRIKPVPEARLLGLLDSPPSRTGRGPNDRRLMPEVDRRETCFVETGVVSSPAPEEVPEMVLPPVRFRLLMVTLDGIYE